VRLHGLEFAAAAGTPGVYTAADYRAACLTFVGSAAAGLLIALFLRETFCRMVEERTSP
jgi:hypothetical protein